MKVVTPRRLGLFGALCCGSGLAWFAIWFHSVGRLYQFNVDIAAPVAPRLLAMLGFWLVVSSLVWAVAVWRRRRNRPTRS